MRTSLEVINRSAILLHIPDDHGNAVKVMRIATGEEEGRESFSEEPMGRWSQ